MSNKSDLLLLIAQASTSGRGANQALSDMAGKDDTMPGVWDETQPYFQEFARQSQALLTTLQEMHKIVLAMDENEVKSPGEAIWKH